MTTRTALLAGAALYLSAAVPVWGQATDRQAWWRSPAVQARMALMPEQVSRIDVIYGESLPARRRLRQQLTTAQQRLARLLADGSMDDARARHVIEQVYEIERQRNVARTLMLFRIYRVLDPSQRDMLLNARTAGGALGPFVSNLSPP